MTQDASSPQIPGNDGVLHSAEAGVPALYWTVAHRCVHCPYTHMVTFMKKPAEGARYGYPCPVTGLRSEFAAGEVMFGQVDHLGLPDGIGVIWGYPAESN